MNKDFWFGVAVGIVACTVFFTAVGLYIGPWLTTTKAELLLDTYDFDELLEVNDLTEEDVVTVLLEQDIISFIKPVDYD